MLGLELLTWLLAGLAVSGAYVLWERRAHVPRGMPLLAGAIGAFGLGWLVHMLGPTDVQSTSYRPLLLLVAVAGAALCVAGYHLYRVNATPRPQ